MDLQVFSNGAASNGIIIFRSDSLQYRILLKNFDVPKLFILGSITLSRQDNETISIVFACNNKFLFQFVVEMEVI